MALQTNLSKKDKMTIAIVLFAALVFVVIWYLIKPTISSAITITEKISQAETTQTEYKNKLISLASGETIYAKTVSDFKDSTAHFYPVMDSSEIDRMVTSYVLKKGLFAENLIISMPKGAVEEKPYVYSSIEAREDRSVSTSAGTDSTDETSSIFSTNTSKKVDSLLTPYTTARANCTSTSSSGVQRVELTLVVTGSYDTCQALIDDLCTKPAVRIVSFEWLEVDKVERTNPETGIVERVDSGKERLRITVNLYMADISDYEVAVSDTVAEAEG